MSEEAVRGRRGGEEERGRRPVMRRKATKESKRRRGDAGCWVTRREDQGKEGRKGGRRRGKQDIWKLIAGNVRKRGKC